ncbi:GNAT family N-acetyltransferase [Enterococcus sp. AZ194]|uniref:GNAT family N-acetyltransferase n=1 Tax=Enterococcus sp. AZ194 TaxID=2774629 RepID=UPI003F6838A6
MRSHDIETIDAAFIQQGWPSRKETLANYFMEQESSQRSVFVAEINQEVAGYVTLIDLAKQGPFKNKFPEIVDFNVFEKYQRQGIGNQLLAVAESQAQRLAEVITLGVGLHAGYGAAQRLYCQRGYVPDGSGVWFNNKPLEMQAPCVNNDELVLYMSKRRVEGI